MATLTMKRSNHDQARLDQIDTALSTNERHLEDLRHEISQIERYMETLQDEAQLIRESCFVVVGLTDGGFANHMADVIYSRYPKTIAEAIEEGKSEYQNEQFFVYNLDGKLVHHFVPVAE